MPFKIGFELLSSLLRYDPIQRLTAHQALQDAWWTEEPAMSKECVHFTV